MHMFHSFLRCVKEILRNTIQFDIGEVEDIVKYYDRDKTPENMKFLKAPFPSILLSCSEDDENYGILICEQSIAQNILPPNRVVDGDTDVIIVINKFDSHLNILLPNIDFVFPINRNNATFGIIDFFNITGMNISIEMLYQLGSNNIIIYSTFLQLLNCKNIEVRTKTYERKGKIGVKPELDYRDIYIKLPGKGIRYKDKVITEIPWKEQEKYGMVGQRRGHFKTYTEERPLLGKHAGTWWWSSVFNIRHRNYQVTIDNE